MMLTLIIRFMNPPFICYRILLFSPPVIRIYEEDERKINGA